MPEVARGSAVAGTDSSTSPQELAQDPELDAFYDRQAQLERPAAVTVAATILHTARTGVLSTLSAASQHQQFPVGSVIQYAPDEQHRPLFATSRLSGHTRNMQTDSRTSFTVLRPGWQGMDDARITLIGHVRQVPEDQHKAATAEFLRANPQSFWVEFGDFVTFRMDKVLAVQYNGGFGRAPKISAQQLAETQPDPIPAIAPGIISHMNDDHADSSRAVVVSSSAKLAVIPLQHVVA
eukprot:jgi/Astpho2/7767/fgenesh1_pg.00117_%23_2_t